MGGLADRKTDGFSDEYLSLPLMRRDVCWLFTWLCFCLQEVGFLGGLETSCGQFCLFTYHAYFLVGGRGMACLLTLAFAR